GDTGTSDLSDVGWGLPSEPLQAGELAGVPVYFLPRHGAAHSIPPHRINYRANIAALKMAGVKSIIACNVVGGINQSLTTGDIVLPDQVIDYTWGRAHTFFDGCEDSDAARMALGLTGLEHIDFTEPFSEKVRTSLIQAAVTAGIELQRGGTYGVTQGPRLESAAEVTKLACDGCDVVGMTCMPEASLARELGMEYAAISLVVNPAAGLGDAGITHAAIRAVIDNRLPVVCDLIERTIQSFAEQP
ncbi:MAG: S-methyl-5'-thioinosine phosphorylase, partial [bacterium]